MPNHHSQIVRPAIFDFTTRTAVIGTGIVALAFAVSACSSGSSSSGSSLSGKTVAVVGPESGDPYYQEVACGAKIAGQKLGLKVGSQQAAASQSQAQQNTIVQNVLAKNPAALIYTPADPVAGGIPLRAARQNNVTVINVDAKLSDSSLYTSFVASNHYAGAKTITTMLAKQMGGKGQIAAVGSLPSNPITQARIKGFEDALKSYPNIHLVSVSYPDLTPSAIQLDASSLLVKYPNLKAFYTTNYINAGGVAVALRNAKLAGKVKMASWDTGAPNVKLLQEGVLTETVAQQPYAMGQLAIQQIANKLQGKPTTKTVSSPLSILTSAAVDTPAGKKLWYKGSCPAS